MSYNPEGEDPGYPDQSPEFKLEFDGATIGLRHNNTGIRLFDVEGGEFDHIVHIHQTESRLQPIIIFFNEFTEEDRAEILEALAELNFPIKHQQELDSLTIKLYSRKEAILEEAAGYDPLRIRKA